MLVYVGHVGRDLYEVFTIRPNGTGKRRITKNTALEASMSWSPDGNWIAFSSGRNENTDVYLVAARWEPGATVDDVESLRQRARLAAHGQRNAMRRLLVVVTASLAAGGLLACGAAQTRGVTAPSGTLVFVVQPTDAYGEVDKQIYGVEPDGTGLTRLARSASDPAVSPDGNTIAFARRAAGPGSNIWLMDVRGKAQRPLTRAGWNHSPAWSADDSMVFFVRIGHEADQILRISTDRRSVRRVLKGSCLYSLTSSPDGRTLAYTVWPSFSSANECDGTPPIVYASDTDGRNSRVLVGADWPEYPAWSPDGRVIAFSNADKVDGQPWGTFVQNTGGGQRRITTRAGVPAWSPDGRWLAIADGDLWLIRSDGKELRRIRKTPRLDENDVVWLPGPTG